MSQEDSSYQQDMKYMIRWCQRLRYKCPPDMENSWNHQMKLHESLNTRAEVRREWNKIIIYRLGK